MAILSVCLKMISCGDNSAMSLIVGACRKVVLVRSSIVPSRRYSQQLYRSVEEHPEPTQGEIHGEFNSSM